MQLLNSARRRGFSTVELLIVLAIIAVILTIAVPTLMTAYTNASETVVIRETQTIHQAQIQYLSQFGEYATTLAQLGPPANGIAGPHAAKLIPASLASGEKNGYVFTLSRTNTGFAANANPKVFGRNGRRTFYIDEDGVVRHNWGPEPATANSPEVK
jgi:type IV pilus assembly protein PilA